MNLIIALVAAVAFVLAGIDIMRIKHRARAAAPAPSGTAKCRLCGYDVPLALGRATLCPGCRYLVFLHGSALADFDD